MTLAGAVAIEVPDEQALAALALALTARGGRAPTSRQRSPSADLLAEVRTAILDGGDPLGDLLCTLRSAGERRGQGATYTPPTLVRSMLDRACERGVMPSRVVDPGAGSGRFLIEAARRFPKARLVGIEIDPLAAKLLDANLAVHGLARRAEVMIGDYREVRLPSAPGPTLFIGNPPYVRHHRLGAAWKRWLTETAERRGLPSSQLAGLHVHFFLATVEHARPGDFGAFVTAAEWLDVNYGKLLRALFLGGLGGSSVTLVAPTAPAFADAMTTAAITCFEVGARKATLYFRRVEELSDLGATDPGLARDREAVSRAARWSPLFAPSRQGPAGFVQLGELCRVHRGQVTGNNAFWTAGPHSEGLPERVFFRAVTRAQELYRAGRALKDACPLARLVDLPVDLDELAPEERRAAQAFLRKAKAAGVHEGYVASHRKPWWSVRLRSPAPILATYMARRAPGFVRNLCAARHLNIAHGLYPRERMSATALDRLRDHLAANTSTAEGRTYAGGLTKFEPKEMERLLVPGPEILEAA